LHFEFSQDRGFIVKQKNKRLPAQPGDERRTLRIETIAMKALARPKSLG
jgi:hypothetical protein